MKTAAAPAALRASRTELSRLSGRLYPGTCVRCRHSPLSQSNVIDPSPNTSLMSWFIAGSEKAHPLPDTQEKVPGPRTESAKKSSISRKVMVSHR